MSDIVRVLQDIAESRGMIYHYGQQSAINIIDVESEDNIPLEGSKVYMLHEFTNRKTDINTTGTGIKGYTYEGKFFLVKHSDYDQPYFDERGTAETSKYTSNIEPLLDAFASIAKNILCGPYELLQWDNIDVTDVLDANMDGLLCSYRIKT